MQTLKLELPEEVKEVLKVIQDNTPDYKVFLGGGYLRDTYKGLRPKDVDVFFVPLKESTTAELYIPKQFYVNYRKDVESVSNTSDMRERGVSRLVGLFNGKLSTQEWQYIVYEKPMTTEALVNDMDINLCRVMYDVSADKMFCSEKFIDGHQYEYIECLIDYDKIRTYHRYERMEAKFPDYDVVGKPTLDVIAEDNDIEVTETSSHNLAVVALIEERAKRSAGSLDEGE